MHMHIHTQIVIYIHTAKLIFSSNSFLKKIMPARGPRKDLWVVVVTTSHSSNGLAASPAAINPLGREKEEFQTEWLANFKSVSHEQ